MIAGLRQRSPWHPLESERTCDVWIRDRVEAWYNGQITEENWQAALRQMRREVCYFAITKHGIPPAMFVEVG
ncbi:MAG: hypothetical protein WC683_15130 [bacterium]